MRLFLALLSALVIPTVLSASLPVVDDYEELYKACRDAGADTFAAIRRGNGSIDTLKYSTCYQVRSPKGGKEKSAAICRSGSCYGYPSGACEGPLPPAPIPVTSPMYLPDADLWAESTLGSAGICQPNGLTGTL